MKKEISTNPEGLQIAQGYLYLDAFFLHLWSDRAQVTIYMMKDKRFYLQLTCWVDLRK